MIFHPLNCIHCAWMLSACFALWTPVLATGASDVPVSIAAVKLAGLHPRLGTIVQGTMSMHLARIDGYTPVRSASPSPACQPAALTAKTLPADKELHSTLSRLDSTYALQMQLIDITTGTIDNVYAAHFPMHSDTLLLQLQTGVRTLFRDTPPPRPATGAAAARAATNTPRDGSGTARKIAVGSIVIFSLLGYVLLSQN